MTSWPFLFNLELILNCIVPRIFIDFWYKEVKKFCTNQLIRTFSEMVKLSANKFYKKLKSTVFLSLKKLLSRSDLDTSTTVILKLKTEIVVGKKRFVKHAFVIHYWTCVNWEKNRWDQWELLKYSVLNLELQRKAFAKLYKLNKLVLLSEFLAFSHVFLFFFKINLLNSRESARNSKCVWAYVLSQTTAFSLTLK